MSDITADQPQPAVTESEPPHQASPPPPPSDEVSATPPLSPAAALFGALVRAGCDAELAYAAVEEAKTMAGENVVAVLTRLERLVTQHGRNSPNATLKPDLLGTRADSPKTN